MKKIFAVLAVIVLTSQLSFAQFKKYDDKKPSYKGSNLLLGFINPNNFTMKHSFNVSMMTTAYGNVSLTSYINSMNYRISNKLDISADVKFQYSPFASSNFGSTYATSLQNNLSGISLSRASLNYKISDNAFINFEYRNVDESDYFGNNYNPFYSGYNGYNSWR